jgi:hypothetical protein
VTQLIFDKTDDDQDQWTDERLKYEFFLDLTKTRCEIKDLDLGLGVERIVHYKKYYKQSRDLMFRIPLTEQYPTEEETVPFVIDWSDLSPKVQGEFSEYCKLHSKQRVRLFLKEVVIRLFENLDYSYAHMSVMKKLRVRLS